MLAPHFSADGSLERHTLGTGQPCRIDRKDPEKCPPESSRLAARKVAEWHTPVGTSASGIHRDHWRAANQTVHAGKELTMLM